MNPRTKISKSPANEPRYVISIAARILSIQTHTLRYYERIGIIEPSRSDGNIRLYSESDISRIKRIKTLIDDMGVNLAGVEVILRLTERIEQLQKQMDELETELDKIHQDDKAE
jgi:MerR family transcriptional regulator, heat shock protein HspR